MIPPLHWMPNPASLVKAGLAAKNVLSSSVVEQAVFSGTALTTLCMIAESALVKALAYDPATRHKLQYLQGRVLSLRLTSPDIHLFIGVGESMENEGYQVTITQHSETVDTELSGHCWDVLRLLNEPPVSLANTGVQVRGSTALLQQWMAIFQGLDIDWEDALIQQMGSLPGHQLADVLRLLMRSEARHRRQLIDLTTRFFSDEAEYTPYRETFAAVQERIQRLREDVSQWATATPPRS